LDSKLVLAVALLGAVLVFSDRFVDRFRSDLFFEASQGIMSDKVSGEKRPSSPFWRRSRAARWGCWDASAREAMYGEDELGERGERGERE